MVFAVVLTHKFGFHLILSQCRTAQNNANHLKESDFVCSLLTFSVILSRISKFDFFPESDSQREHPVFADLVSLVMGKKGV